VWFIGIALVAAVLIIIAVEGSGSSAPVPYSAFLDQLEAGNAASVAFQGTEINGRWKQPLADASSSGAARSDRFATRVPDIGDPALIAELRRQHVTIDVNAPSAWVWLLGRVPWPMLFLLAALVVAGAVRLLRGGRTPSGSAMVTPAHGMIGLLSGLFARPQRRAGGFLGQRELGVGFQWLGKGSRTLD
jgi:ATP-dependent Zn protease